MTDALDPVLCAQLIHVAKPWRWSVDRPPVSMSIDDAAAQLATQLEAALARISALETRQQLLELAAKLTRETPYPAELDECRAARSALIAEVGTLRATHAETQLSITEHAEDILGPHPRSTPAEELKLVSAHDFRRQQYIAHLEVQIACLASLFDADPSQPVDDDIASIERGIKRLTASLPNWSHAETLKQREALIVMDVEARGRLRALEAELAAVREVSRVSIEVQRMRIVALEANQRRAEDTSILDNTIALLEATAPAPLLKEISIPKSVVEILSSDSDNTAGLGQKSCAGAHLPEGAAEWLLQGERGLSSEAIFSHLTEIPLTRGHMVTPADSSDLRRCRRLLDQVPSFRGALPRMAAVSPRWKALIERWDEVCAMMDMEAPDWRNGNGTTPRTNDMLFRIDRQVAHDLAGCEVCR